MRLEGPVLRYLQLATRYTSNRDALTWSRNGPETVLVSSRRVGTGDVHSRQNRAEALVESIRRSAQALPQQQEGEHHACASHTGSLQDTSTRGAPASQRCRLRGGSPGLQWHD